MKIKIVTRLKSVLFALLALLLFFPFFTNGGGRYALSSVSASATSGDLIEIQALDVDMTVGKDRKIEVKEKITVKFLQKGLTMFYRPLPTDGARYSDIVATCEGNDEFEYYVDDNPDVDGFIDINCVGNAEQGNVWTYDISYTMQQGVYTHADGMIIDVVGFGWTVPLHNVTVEVHLPEKPISYEVYDDIFGAQTQNEVSSYLSADGKTVKMSAEVLDRGYSAKYDEYVTGGITLNFTLPEGVLENYVATRIFTEDTWKILLGALGAVGLAVILLIFTRKKREIVTVVNIKAPDEMDPMRMGKWLDGAVNDEDVTSMIYYFANKGYLRIDMTDENDPELISRVNALPAETSTYEKTLFNGLFAKVRAVNTVQPFAEAGETAHKAVRISETAGKFYDAMEIAKRQVPNPPTMYETKSVLGYVGGCLIALLLGIFVPLLMGKRLGGGYSYGLGVTFAFPIAAIALIGYISENYRYKWKSKKRTGMLIAQVAIAVIYSVIFTMFFAGFIMTEGEKLVLCLGVFGACFATQTALSRTEKYANVLGDILGFKDFIVVTEEDKIKFMLEENPELYYKVLPYAQVLGVTDEWTDKFERLTIEPPEWYRGRQISTFDCYILHRSLNRAMAREIAAEVARRSKSSGSSGGRIGRSGGGRSFGGFGGGGFGGGGGGAR